MRVVWVSFTACVGTEVRPVVAVQMLGALVSSPNSSVQMRQSSLRFTIV